MSYVVLVFEDELSGAVLDRLLEYGGRRLVVHWRITARGSGNIRRDVATYLNASRHVPHIVLTDLDNFPCPPALLATWGIVHPPAELMFRVAVREVEAWLLADRSGLSGFLNVAEHRIPASPEAVGDPKRALIDAARRSRSRRLASEIPPDQGSHAPQGVLYNLHLCRFVRECWNVQVAAESAPSLARMMARLDEFLRRPA